jgi:peptide deformylase
VSVVPIKIYGEDVLRQIAKPVENITQDTIDMVEHLIATMNSESGLGLAANQIGITERAFAINMTHFDILKKPKVLINPEIVDLGKDQIKGEEGCLSFPGLFQSIERPEKVSVKYLDLDGNEQFMDADGLIARVILHEIDHLDGILFIDKLPAGQKLFIKGKLKRIKAGERV